MPTYVESAISDFSLSPNERRQRQEIMEAIHTVHQAIKILSDRQDMMSTDLRSRQIVVSCKNSIAKIQTYVEKSFSANPPTQ